MVDHYATEPCFSCGALVPSREGPVHGHLRSSPGCWALYGEVLAREYEDAAYMANHQLTVDAYAVQHPGDAPSRAARRSVHLHLASLCAALEHGRSPTEARNMLKRLADGDFEPEWLEPPASPGSVTVADVHAAEGVEAHLAAVERWARSAWEAWAPHHDVIVGRVARLI